MSGKSLRLTSATASFFLLLSVGLDPVVAAENTDPIIVGVVHSDAYPSDDMMKRSFEMAVEAKNDAGGVKRLRRIQDNPPDVVYMVSYLDDAVLLVDRLRALNIGSLLIGAGGGFTDSRFIESLGSSAKGIMTAALWSPRLPYPGATDYSDRYVERYKEAPDYHGAEAYAAVLVAADVLGRAESLAPEAIRSALNDANVYHTESRSKIPNKAWLTRT